MIKKSRMESKNILVTFLAIASVLLLAVTVSAADYTIQSVKVDGVNWDDSASVIAGETVSVKVRFTSNVFDSDVRVKVEIEGEKTDVKEVSDSFDVEENNTYRKTLTLKVPYDLEDELSDDTTITVEIDGADTELEDERELRVQRPSFNADVKSVSVSDTVEAGETVPVDVVLKNIGYNDLDDVFVSVSIPALGTEESTFLGDIVAIECDDGDEDEPLKTFGVNVTDRDCNEDDEDTLRARLYLEIPEDANAGLYTLEVEVSNDDNTQNVVRQISVENDFENNVIVTSSSKTMAVGEDTEYDLLIVNPTSKLKVYRVISESSDGLSTSVDSSVIAVPAGSSKTVSVNANADAEGEYDFDVTVLSNDELVNSVTLSAKVEGQSSASFTKNPVTVLTVILAIVFLVLLIVLIVLIGKKPNKSEEFGESYY